MALKDWKKIGKKYGYEAIWENKKSGIRIGVNDDFLFVSGNKRWQFIGEDGYTPKKEFDTKSQAFKFAKSYMRKH